jgi:hypothetical protein
VLEDGELALGQLGEGSADGRREGGTEPVGDRRGKADQQLLVPPGERLIRAPARWNAREDGAADVVPRSRGIHHA